MISGMIRARDSEPSATPGPGIEHHPRHHGEHGRSLGWVPDDLLDNVTQVCEVRKPFGHWRQPLDPGTPWRRIAEQLSAVPQLNPDELVERLAAADPDELVERLIAADAELAAVTALQLYLGGYGVGPYESPSHR